MEKYWALHLLKKPALTNKLYFVTQPQFNIVAGSNYEKDSWARQMKYAPYFMVTVFASLTAVLRYYLMPEWGWWHLPLLLYQILLFIGFWQLIKFINSRLNKWYPFERGPLKRMAVQNLLTILILAPIAFTGLYFGRDYVPDFVNTQFMATMILVFLVVILMFNFAFYTLHFFSNWQATIQGKTSLEIQAAELEKEKSAMQYQQLKNQVNPHYLFNMLTSLDGLVHTNPDLASDFIRHMSKVYRYVLQHKESEVVNLEDELDFIGHYIELLQIRYGQGLSIHTKVSDNALGKGIVMITLQMLIDNAIKHNIVQASMPLRIVIWDEGDNLLVHNNMQLRKQIETSNGKGLEQLKQLYSFLTDKKIVTEENEENFTIRIPLI